MLDLQSAHCTLCTFSFSDFTQSLFKDFFFLLSCLFLSETPTIKSQPAGRTSIPHLSTWGSKHGAMLSCRTSACSDNSICEDEVLCLKPSKQPKHTQVFLAWLRRAALECQLCHCHVPLEAAGVLSSSPWRWENSGSYKPSLRSQYLQLLCCCCVTKNQLLVSLMLGIT